MKRELTKEEIKAAVEHRDLLRDVQQILGTQAGKNFFRYLFKHFDVPGVPPLGVTGEVLMEQLGFMRAGNSIFKLASEASVEITASLLAKVEKDRQDEIYAEYVDEQDAP